MQIFPFQNLTGETSYGLVRHLNWDENAAKHFELVLKNVNPQMTMMEALAFALQNSGLSARKHLARGNELLLAMKPRDTDHSFALTKELHLIKQMTEETYLIHPHWALSLRHQLCGEAVQEVQTAFDEYSRSFGILGIQHMVIHLDLLEQAAFCSFAARNEFDVIKMYEEVNNKN